MNLKEDEFGSSTCLRFFHQIRGSLASRVLKLLNKLEDYLDRRDVRKYRRRKAKRKAKTQPHH
jgi:hypothetical protein